MKRVDYIGEGIGVVMTAVQTEQIFQTISLIITIISITVSLAFTLWKWWKEAKKDGKIDSSEVHDAVNIIKEHKEKISDEVKSSSKDDKRKEE